MLFFYRSGIEYNLFAEKIGKKYLKDIKFARKTADTLIKMSDEINDFIKQNQKLKNLIEDWNKFYILYRNFFAFHQAIYWSSEYLKNIKFTKQNHKINNVIKILDKAYKYNEIVVPNVEEYFIKLGIENLLYNEIKQNILPNIRLKSKRRSLLMLDNKIYIVLAKEANKIDKAIQKDYQRYLENHKKIKGLPISNGIVRGRVKIIKDLKRLKNCKQDDILITTQTRPQYNVFIKKVKAIIIDEGGYLCHASILAREFKIPCIVGTKIATKVLKDGDLVEVDAEQGIVKILKKNKT